MRVFRIEHPKCGVGPYNAMHHLSDFEESMLLDRILTEALNANDWDTESTPTPEHDGITGHDSSFYFGFDSIDQMYDWFGHRAMAVFSEHYHVVEYEIPEGPHIKVGGRQVAFRKHKAARIGVVA